MKNSRRCSYKLLLLESIFGVFDSRTSKIVCCKCLLYQYAPVRYYCAKLHVYCMLRCLAYFDILMVIDCESCIVSIQVDGLLGSIVLEVRCTSGYYTAGTIWKQKFEVPALPLKRRFGTSRNIGNIKSMLSFAPFKIWIIGPNVIQEICSSFIGTRIQKSYFLLFSFWVEL